MTPVAIPSFSESTAWMSLLLAVRIVSMLSWALSGSHSSVYTSAPSGIVMSPASISGSMISSMPSRRNSGFVWPSWPLMIA